MLGKKWASLFMISLVFISGCKTLSKSEDFSSWPYEVTETPYRTENYYGRSLAWVDNETLLFVTWLEKNRGKQVLGEWKTDGSFKVLADEGLNVCTREGYVGYYTETASGEVRVFFGRYGGTINEYTDSKRIDFESCMVTDQGYYWESDRSKLFDLNQSGAYVARPTLSQPDHLQPAHLIKANGEKVVLPFSADVMSYRYYDHMGKYYVNLISTWQCDDTSCWDSEKSWFIWSFDADGHAETININKKFPWFGIPIVDRIEAPIYYLYPTKQGDFIEIDGTPSWLGGRDGMYLMKEGADAPVKLINGAVQEPAFSPDGCKIAFLRNKDKRWKSSWMKQDENLTIIDLCKPNKRNVAFN